jgi:hypothetical protein
LSNSGSTVTAGLIAGSLDITATSILVRSQGIAIQKLLQTIASGVLGPRAFDLGRQSALLGLFFHFLIALTSAAVYLAAAEALPVLIDRPILSGTLFGVAVHLVMSLIVVPLSRVRRPFSARRFVIQLFVHILFIGLPIGVTISHLSRAA